MLAEMNVKDATYLLTTFHKPNDYIQLSWASKRSESAREPAMLTIDVERSEDVAVVRCAGRLVRGQEVSTLKDAVISENNTRIVVLDLSAVEMVDAGGLNALVSLHNWTRDRGIKLKLVNPSPFVYAMLKCTQLDRVFEISSLHDAFMVLVGADCREARHAASM
jgi:anti-sigma B factor antagonist